MTHKKRVEELSEIWENLNNKFHYTAGLMFQRAERVKAHNCMKLSELEAIYHLVESHSPTLRLKTALRYEKVLTSVTDNAQFPLNKDYVESSCTDKISNNIQKLLGKVQEMPQEWTMVQLTPHYNPQEYVETSLNIHYTNSLYLTVFNCGENQPKPFCVNIDAPRDSVTGGVVQLAQEIHSIVADNKQTLTSSKVATHFRGVTEKQDYYSKRQATDDRLKLLVKDLQNIYLREWKCFMIGKYIDNNLEVKIQKRIKDFFQAAAPTFFLDDKSRYILHYLIKSCHYLKLAELKRAIEAVVPGSLNKMLQKNLAQFIRSVSDELRLSEQKRHPLILIIDDSLDCFPWEMMDILFDVPVSRLPSVHLAYALFQQNKETIKNGFKIVQNSKNGTYIVNPDLDLTNMQNRILSFYEYWVPSWKGVVNCKPTAEQFEEMLVSGDIFAYNGHGNGSHFFPLHKIERIIVKAVVLLFGCSSTKLNAVGPQTEMYSVYKMYLIACSPCIIGNLWEVTDLDTDILTTELLSQWIPNPKKVHWKHLDKSKWRKGEKVNFVSEIPNNVPNIHPHEPELLTALSNAKKSHLLSFYITKAAIVARGIPVKLVIK